eukprot:COSAG01_NODE_3601_length_5888_cov_506.113146_6_plen_68_part_00
MRYTTGTHVLPVQDLSVLYYGTATYPFCIRVYVPYYTYGCTAAREAKQGSQLRDKELYAARTCMVKA